MIIKAWNNHDMGVFQIQPALKKLWLKELRDKFTKDEIKCLRSMAAEFAEKLGVVFSHNLKRGWESKLFDEGKILTRSGKEITTVGEMKETFRRDGQIQFFAYGKNKSLKAIKRIMKPSAS